MDSINIATGLAEFLRDYGVYATEALLIIAVVVLFRALRKSETEKLALAMQVLPLVDRLSSMLTRAARKNHRLPGPPQQPPT